MNDKNSYVHDIFNSIKNSQKMQAEYDFEQRLDLAIRKSEYEETLNTMWRIYKSGNVKQIVEYNKQKEHIKALGAKIYRNSLGEHKIIIKD